MNDNYFCRRIASLGFLPNEGCCLSQYATEGGISMAKKISGEARDELVLAIDER
jgi:hypothetical protein